MNDGKNSCLDEQTFDFRPLGQAIKHARELRGITREQLAEQLDYAPRHLQSIENKGQHPSLELFVQLVRMFDIPVDPFIFPKQNEQRSTLRQQLAAQLDMLDENDLVVLESTILGLLKVKKLNNHKPEV